MVQVRTDYERTTRNRADAFEIQKVFPLNAVPHDHLEYCGRLHRSRVRCSLTLKLKPQELLWRSATLDGNVSRSVAPDLQDVVAAARGPNRIPCFMRALAYLQL